MLAEEEEEEREVMPLCRTLSLSQQPTRGKRLARSTPDRWADGGVPAPQLCTYGTHVLACVD